MITAETIGYIIGYLLVWNIGWLMMKSGNPLLIVIGVLLWIGVVKAVISDIGNMIHVSFHWVEHIIYSMWNTIGNCLS
jgi:hypothetical protein